ncbi:MAG: ABC transporter permease [Firmicutes bacterium]|nr:ABC transporter permease [Bacillota bacterium]
MPAAARRAEGLRLLLRNPLAAVGGVTVLLLALLALFAPVLAPAPGDAFSAVHPAQQLLPPGPGHPFGTDELGRDLFTRVLYGARISLAAGAVAIAAALAIGVPLGAVAGYAGGFWDELIMRFTDVVLSFPSLLLATAIAAMLGHSLTNAVAAIALSWWPWYTRIVRAQVVSLRERPFVEAARALGVPGWRIVFEHLVPNALAPVIVQASLDFGSVILTLAALSFLGIGAQPPQPEWGLLINTGRNFFLTNWWYVTFPGLAIFLTVAAFNLLGDGLREILDPRTRGRV